MTRTLMTRRFDTLSAVKASPARGNGQPAVRPHVDLEKVFGENTFSLTQMKDRLPAAAYEGLIRTIDDGTELDAGVADAVAKAMKEWALEKGATHFTHWFQPLTGLTAEKHDSFVSPTGDGRAITAFRGKELVQGEPDASSFPSGGLRATFEARGYTAWDPTSPAFLVESAAGAFLAIPTAFASWTGAALDQKIPLLRSIHALNDQVMRALALFKTEARRVRATLGPEQEFFLVDEEFVYRRPDLITCNRTLFGAKPPRGQELEDHYFGSISDRVLDCMNEVELELYRLGVPISTRHNEVAPGQYEEANIAADHQQLTMSTLRRVARKYGLVALLHEKPFAGVNGSGKHLNWSFGTESQNLLEPGETPHDNMQFLFFCCAVLKAVERHQDLLRVSVAYAGNDHRLGANEAPPAIISVFLGDQLTDILDQIEATGSATHSGHGGLLGLGVRTLPNLPKHAGDRNRTSPFAFTGNKFEFRALGGSQSISMSAMVLNTIMAEAVDEMVTALESAMTGGADMSEALRKLLAEEIVAFKRIIFNGDNYTPEWATEAERRGLLNLKNTMDALPKLVEEQNVALFEKYGVLSRREIESRFEILLDQYFKTINIEGETLADMASTMVLPAGLRYLGELLQSLERAKDAGIKTEGMLSTAKGVNDAVEDLRSALDALIGRNAESGGDSVHSKAHHMHDHIVPAMAGVRKAMDRLEKIVPDDLWPVPTYRDMLFVK